jgi:histidinol-phosphate aminotransferase
VELMEGKIIKQFLEKDFSLNLDKLMSKITAKTKLIFVSNPNNPTGNLLLTLEKIEKLLKSFKGVLVIDEAYFEFLWNNRN